MKATLLFILLLISFIGKAQLITVDTCFVNNTSKQFFKKNQLADKVFFFISANGSKSIDVYKKGTWQDTSYKFSKSTDYETYDLDFIGDNYFFHKKFGELLLPEKEIGFISKNKCASLTYARGYIYPDSIRCKVEFQCPVEIKNDTDVIVFTKIEVPWGYKNGMKALQNKIHLSYQKKYTNKNQILTDSAYMFSIIVDKKEGCLLRIELTHGNYSPFVQFLIDELRKACEWTPGMAGGRPVKSFIKIFIRLNKDGSFLVAMPNDQPEQK